MLQIPAIELAAASVFPEKDLPLHIRYRVTERDVLAEARADDRLWVVLDLHGRAVGFALVEVVGGLAHVDEIDVHPDHARQGIGSTLLQLTIDWARHERFPAMTLVTFRHLAWNAPFYEKFGFIRLAQDELSDDISAILDDEDAVGMNMKNRVAMRLSLI